MAKYIDAKTLESAATGRWMQIFRALVPALQPAIDAWQRGGVHVNCPLPHKHAAGGLQDFRFFRDADRTGNAICTCGHYAPLAL